LPLKRPLNVRQITSGPFPAANLAQDYPPTPEEHQDLLDRIVEPALTAALQALNSVDSPDFSFTITERMQGESSVEADPLELDLTEIYGLRTVLEAALASIDIALAYLVTPSPYGAQGFEDALTAGSTFLTLASDGATRLADAQARLLRGADFFGQALDFLEAETDDQSDDLIKYDPTGNLSESVDSGDLQEARDILADVEGALSGPTTVTEDFGRGQVDLVVDASQFFLNPIADMKTLLPEHEFIDGEFHWSALTFDEWTMPDPTFNGILPGIASSDELKEKIDLTGGYTDIGGPITGFYQLVSINGTDIPVVFNEGAPDEYYVLHGWVNLWLAVNMGFDLGESDGFGGFTWTDQKMYDGTLSGARTPTEITIQLDLTDDMGAPETFNGTISGDTMTLTVDGDTWVFVRY
jgi:hypothetical protein